LLFGPPPDPPPAITRYSSVVGGTGRGILTEFDAEDAGLVPVVFVPVTVNV
jgi:hypothetical protein